jgi:hypothetical protein
MSTVKADYLVNAAGTGAPTLTNGAVLPAGSASAPAISPTGDSNTGVFFPAADTIAFAEGGVEAMRIDSSGNLLFNSGYGSVATAYGCRAWVIFAGASGTVSGSGNVTSVSRSAVGTYTINFTSAMPNANYCITGVSSGSTSGSTSISGAGASGDFSRSTGSVTVYSVDASGNANVDAVTVCVAIFR